MKMYLLDPDKDGCTIWNLRNKKVQHVDGNAFSIGELMTHLAAHIETDEWGEKLVQHADIYVDISGFGKIYADVLDDNGLEVIEVVGQKYIE